MRDVNINKMIPKIRILAVTECIYLYLKRRRFLNLKCHRKTKSSETGVTPRVPVTVTSLRPEEDERNSQIEEKK